MTYLEINYFLIQKKNPACVPCLSWGIMAQPLRVKAVRLKSIIPNLKINGWCIPINYFWVESSFPVTNPSSLFIIVLSQYQAGTLVYRPILEVVSKN
jgi:hypothetical protein